jgi:hypothetical protein
MKLFGLLTITTALVVVVGCTEENITAPVVALNSSEFASVELGKSLFTRTHTMQEQKLTRRTLQTSYHRVRDWLE